MATLAGAVFLTATGGIGPIVGTLGAGFAQALDRLVASPVPSEAVAVATNSPLIAVPDSPYTNQSTIDLRVTVPAEVLNDPNAKLRVKVALQGLDAAPIDDVAIGSSITVIVPVDLTKGRNDFTATIIRSGVESDSSPVVTVFLDQVPPKVTIKSPKNGTTVNDPNLTLKGATEAKTILTARNDADGVAVTVTAANDGTFQLVLPLEPGTNAIHIDATDLAGNESATDLSYVQGSGKMHANLTASLYRISISHPPGSLQLTVIVTDPDGAPLVGATASFTLQIPGLGPISGSAVTGADGRAHFTTPLVGKITAGNGEGVVQVTHPVFGETTDRVALTFVK